MKPLITFAVTLATCLTILAQRTPLSVNGTVISNPNLTNSSGVTYSVSGTANSWKGRIDEVGVWRRTLTTAERSYLYNSGAGRTYPF